MVKYKSFNNVEPTFKRMVLFFALYPIVGFFFSYVFHNQNFTSSLLSSAFNFFYLFFFVLEFLDVQEKDLVRIFFILGIAWVLISVIQQFTYPTYLFGAQETEKKIIEVRNNIYRFRMDGRQYVIPMLFYSFVEYISSRKKIYLLFLSIGLVGVYLTVTRQVIFTVIICMLYGTYFLRKHVYNIKYIIIFSVILFLLNFDLLFGNMIEQTDNDLNEDYIRFACYNFYGFEYNKNNLFVCLFGNGLPSLKSAYGLEIYQISRSQHFFQADIGIVGIYSWFGIIYVCYVISFFIYIYKNRSFLDLYLKMYVLYMAFTSVMLWHFTFNAGIVTSQTCIFYLIYKSIERNKYGRI